MLELLLSIFVAVPCGGFYVDDPYDAYPLDARHVCVERRGGDLVFTIETWGPFADYRLREVEEPPVAIGINTRGGRGGRLYSRRGRAFEVLVFTGAGEVLYGGYVPFGLVTTGPRRPEADFSSFSPREKIAGYARVERVAPDAVEIAFPSRLLPLRRDGSFRWQLRVVSEWAPGDIAFDYAPNSWNPRFGPGSARP